MARLTGIAEHYAGGFGDADAATVRESLERHRDGEPLAEPLGDIVGELRAVSTDRQVLAQAAARYTGDDPSMPYAPWVLRLLELAGADLEAARAWREAHPPRGFTPPQADPERDRRG